MHGVVLYFTQRRAEQMDGSNSPPAVTVARLKAVMSIPLVQKLLANPTDSCAMREKGGAGG